jgi:phosphatidylserine/phosphatidylglycerophosphate/cardiolipin synthase-like enzyme
MFVQNSNKHGFSVKAWQGDAKTLLAFNFDKKTDTKNLAGFSIQVQPHGKPAYYLLNMLSLPAGKHAVAPGEPANSSANAPIQKFRWLHVPGLFHQGDTVFYGAYTYTITPRYFNQSGLLQAMDNTLAESVDVQVVPFASSQVELGFTRGFTQSQAFIHHFGDHAIFRPSGKELLFDTKAKAQTNNEGQSYTFEQEYEWSGFTARERIFDLLNEAINDSSLTLDVFAYDLNEPDVAKALLQLASEGRVRVILDNASLHHTPAGTPEDDFEKQFNDAAKAPAEILRGKFGRYSHDKVFIVSKNSTPVKVLSGSTNFSVTGMYVNSNHVIIFDNADVAKLYSGVFGEAWDCGVKMAFTQSNFAAAPFEFNQKGLPKMSITFSPHDQGVAESILYDMAKRISASTSSVLFAVMDVSSGGGPVFPALQALHQNQSIFSYGISDSPGGISLYKPGSMDGVLVGGKPGTTVLPPPFEQERAISGIGHQIHHKFIVCDFNTDDPVVWCGSSNLALGGEHQNGDNLIQIHDADIAAVFAIEALGLVDHFDFRNAHAAGKNNAATAPKAPKGGTKKKPAPHAGTSKPFQLYDNDSWAERYFDQNDLYYADRELFG